MDNNCTQLAAAQQLCINNGLYGFNIIDKLKRLKYYLGPAFIISVAYIDPGNFAANISGGSRFNYSLLWVILWSNLMAIFLQSLSAKLGIATGFNLPQMCGKLFSKKLNWCFWVIAQLSAMATNLAEFLGAALGLYLLFNIPMVYAGALTAILTFFIVYLSRFGQRVVEIIITVFVAVICIAYTAELFLCRPDWSAIALYTIMPSLANSQALLIAVSMLGATVMPHAIYLHSQLVQCRNCDKNEHERVEHYKMARADIAIAMNIAFVVNAAMVVVSAAVFFKFGIAVQSIEQAHSSLSPLLGSLSGAFFGIALLASGLSSSAVGTMAGQTVLQGFVNIKLSDNIARIITIIPGLLLIIFGVNPMNALVLSQVVLSIVLPVAIIPMLIITSRSDIMGRLVNKRSVNILGWVITTIIIALNSVLLYLTVTGRLG